MVGDSSPRYDTTGIAGIDEPLSSATTYADALALAGEFVITRIDFVADDPGGGGSRTLVLWAINVSTAEE